MENGLTSLTLFNQFHKKTLDIVYEGTLNSLGHT